MMPIHPISLRATLAATGAFPYYVRLNPRNAFRDSNPPLEEVTPLLGLDAEEIMKTSTIINTQGIVSNAC